MDGAGSLTSPAHLKPLNWGFASTTIKVLTVIKYAVVDRHTGEQVGKAYTSKSRARSRVDALDNAYGAYRYTVKQIEVKGL